MFPYSEYGPSSDWRALEGLTYLVFHGNSTWRTVQAPIVLFISKHLFLFIWPTIGDEEEMLNKLLSSA